MTPTSRGKTRRDGTSLSFRASPVSRIGKCVLVHELFIQFYLITVKFIVGCLLVELPGFHNAGRVHNLSSVDHAVI